MSQLSIDLPYIFTIEGYVKPAVRMTKRSMHCDPQAQEYLDFKVAAGMQLKAQMAKNGYEMLPPQTPLRVTMRLQEARSIHGHDLDNSCKSILDSARGIVWPDDRWIDSIEISRYHGEKDSAILIVNLKNGVGDVA